MSSGSKAARLRRSTSGLKLAVMAEEDGDHPVAAQNLIRALSPQSSEGRQGVARRRPIAEVFALMAVKRGDTCLSPCLSCKSGVVLLMAHVAGALITAMQALGQ